MAILSGPVWGPASGAAPKQLVVLCHGVGADGRDLIALAPFFAGVLPDALFVAPDGPEPYDMAPFGRQWFPIGDINPAKLGGGVRRAAKTLDVFIDNELSRLKLTDYALIGFSQGAMTALFTGLRRAAAPRAVLAYSGALIEPQTLGGEAKSSPPVLLAHGESDDIVPAFHSRDAEVALRAAGVPAELVLEPGLGHGIGEAGLAAGVALLRRAFA
ncbi:MAG TPA: prolyl oligopeptidase family serine peptidase [Acidocella sp.]|nr:prolyl oligopeptidase family serine peptidase [Acidocella sp.]